MVIDVMRRFTGQNRYRALLPAETPGGMQRRPRAFPFVFRLRSRYNLEGAPWVDISPAPG